jgi:hypothetical protein
MNRIIARESPVDPPHIHSSDQRRWQDGLRHCQGCGESLPDPPKFVAHHETVLQTGQIVGRMISKTMAKRTANALNRHIPNREGV